VQSDNDDEVQSITDDDRIAYEVVSQRRIHHDNLVWQVPVLSMTAQSFLFTIALGAGNTETSRTIACILAFTISVLSVNLMLRHRGFELASAIWLEDFETQHGLKVQHRVTPSYKGPRCLRWLGNITAFAMWLWGLILFGMTAIVTLVIAWLPWHLLN
jgi:hypothetical protein